MFLVKGDGPQQFLTGIGTDTGKKVSLGDPEKFKRMQPTILAMHAHVGEAYDKLSRLHFDRTRTETSKHVAAKTLATRLVDAVNRGRNDIVLESNKLAASGQQSADDTFAPVGNRQAIDTAILNWIKETAAQPDGMAKIKKEANASIDVAAVIYNAPHFLTGMAKQLHTNMRLEAVKRFDPSAHQSLNESVELAGLVPKYDKFVGKVHSSFYTPAIADTADTRVDVEA